MKKYIFIFSIIFFSYTVTGQCNAPTNIHIQNELFNLNIVWDANGSDTWDLEYGVEGFTPTGTPTINDFGYNHYPLEDISEHTYIDFYVRADCGASTSDWAGPFTFYNHCFEGLAWSGSEVYEYFETDFIPACWTESNQGSPDTGVGVFGDSAWLQDYFANDSSNSLAAKITIGGIDEKEWLLLPPMEGVQGCKNTDNLSLDFDIALTDSGTTSPTSLGSDDVIQLVISPDLGITWFTIKTWDSDSNISNTGETAHFEYINNSDGFDLFEKVFLVAFWVNSGTIDDGTSADFFIDNVTAIPPFTGSVNDLLSKGFSYYPNPTHDLLYVNAKEKIDNLTLYNSLGTELKNIQYDSADTPIDISRLNNGIYFLRVQIGKVVGVVPVIKY